MEELGNTLAERVDWRRGPELELELEREEKGSIAERTREERSIRRDIVCVLYSNLEVSQRADSRKGRKGETVTFERFDLIKVPTKGSSLLSTEIDYEFEKDTSPE